MARKRLDDGLQDWAGADEVLRGIGGLERRIEGAEAKLQATIAKAKAAAAAEVKQLQTQIKLASLRLQAFCQEHQEDLGGKKSKTINFGVVGFQYSTKIILPRKKELAAAVVEKLKSLGLTQCIKIKETPLKEEIKKLDEQALAQLTGVGVKKEGKNTFWYKVNREKIVETG